MARSMFSLTNMRVLCICVGAYHVMLGLLMLGMTGWMKLLASSADIPMVNVSSVIPVSAWLSTVLLAGCGMLLAWAGWYYLKTWNTLHLISLAGLLITSAAVVLLLQDAFVAMEQFISDLPGNGILFRRRFKQPGWLPVVVSAFAMAIPWLVLFFVAVRNRALIRAGETLGA